MIKSSAGIFFFPLQALTLQGSFLDHLSRVQIDGWACFASNFVTLTITSKILLFLFAVISITQSSFANQDTSLWDPTIQSRMFLSEESLRPWLYRRSQIMNAPLMLQIRLNQ